MMGANTRIPFNKPYLSGKELYYVAEAIRSGKTSGNGFYTQKCHEYFQEKYGLKKVLLTTSCTHALEMAAILIGIKKGDEVIIPSFTFVSSANAFIIQGAKAVFADSCSNQPNVDAERIEPLITTKTKAIVVVHYAGVACDMDKIMELANKYGLYVIEDAAHAIDSYYKENMLLGSIGHLSTFSFHETKNIISGEGGMLVINDDRFHDRAEIIWEKGTNRAAFWRGEVDKYNWVDVGSSYLPSEMIAAFLFAQLENLNDIQVRRKQIWKSYFDGLEELKNRHNVNLPVIPEYAKNNGHMFYLVCNNELERSLLINFLKKRNINAVFHYLSLHKSPFYKDKHDGRELFNTDKYAECLVRLPFYHELTDEAQSFIINTIIHFYDQHNL